MDNLQKQVVELYREGHSASSIAKQLNTYPKKIYKLLRDAKEPIRSRSEAGKIGVAKGRISSPTAGRQRTEEEKLKIGLSNQETWENLPESKKKKHREQARKEFESRGEKFQEEFRKKATQGILKAAKEGSKFERYLYEGLEAEGYNVVPHKEHLLVNEKFEVDLFIPAVKVAIEVDGPTHYSPIYGKDAYEKRKKADERKNGLLNAAGIGIIRCRQKSKNLTRTTKEKGLRAIIEILESDQPPYIKEIEV